MLRSQGYKPNELFIKGQPFEESLIRVIDLFCQRNFGMTVDSAKYIRPAAKYFNVSDFIFVIRKCNFFCVTR